MADKKGESRGTKESEEIRDTREELKSDGTVYILCPDSKCRIFDSYTSFPGLDRHYTCPKKDKMTYLAKCFNCSERINLGQNYSIFQRISHKCPDGTNPSLFPKRYLRVYSLPKE